MLASSQHNSLVGWLRCPALNTSLGDPHDFLTNHLKLSIDGQATIT